MAEFPLIPDIVMSPVMIGGVRSAIPEMAVPRVPVQLTSPVPSLVDTCQSADGASTVPDEAK